MKLVLTNDNLVDEILANPIYTENGIMFLNKGNKITNTVIYNLKRMGVTTIYIEDGNDEIDLQEILPAPIKLQAIKSLKQIFGEVKDREYVNEKKAYQIVSDIMSNINLSENAAIISNLAPNDEISKLAVHSLDVTILTIVVGIRKKYNEKQLMKLGTASLLHDIGKIFTSERNHLVKGQEILKRNPLISSITYMSVYYMYEREDGSGLFGVDSEKVHEFAKILGMCNEYMKLVSGENGVLPHVAIEKIAADAVSKFNKEIYKDFLQSVYCYPNGLQVRLNNGTNAVVVMQNSGSTTRPILVTETNEGYKFCNLAETENLTLFIDKVVI